MCSVTDHYRMIVKVTPEELARLKTMTAPKVEGPLYYATRQNGLVEFYPPFGNQHLELYWRGS